MTCSAGLLSLPCYQSSLAILWSEERDVGKGDRVLWVPFLDPRQLTLTLGLRTSALLSSGLSPASFLATVRPQRRRELRVPQPWSCNLRCPGKPRPPAPSQPSAQPALSQSGMIRLWPSSGSSSSVVAGISAGNLCASLPYWLST